MPWHDIGVQLCGQGARDIARHFIQRWNYIKSRRKRFNDEIPYLLPQAAQNNGRAPAPPFDCVPECELGGEPMAQWSLNDVVMCRSIGEWSMGCRGAPETSIHHAYLYHIAHAKQLIYIENEFFISSLPKLGIHNQLVDALYHRIVRAHEANQKFRVVVVLPLLPGFKGTVHDHDAKWLRKVAGFLLNTLVVTSVLTSLQFADGCTQAYRYG